MRRDIRNWSEPTTVITFLGDLPCSTDHFVITEDCPKICGGLRAGSPMMYNPDKYAPPGWLTLKRAADMYQEHTGRRKEFTTRKEAQEFLFEYFKPLAVEPTDDDFSDWYLKKRDEEQSVDNKDVKWRPLALKMDTPKRTHTALPLDSKILRNEQKVAKSDKNKERHALYTGSKTIKEILDENPDIKPADIKYDIRCGYGLVGETASL